MGKYSISISKAAQKDLSILKRSGRKADIKKVETFFKEIESEPRDGTGQPEQLKHYDGEVWSRKVNKKDRFVYEIYEHDPSVVVVQALGHYSDK